MKKLRKNYNFLDARLPAILDLLIASQPGDIGGEEESESEALQKFADKQLDSIQLNGRKTLAQRTNVENNPF